MDSQWDVVYERAIRDDGSLFFPERLTHDFLERARRTMGSYLFANQYQNVIVPDEEKRFKKEWLRYSTDIPKLTTRFGFIDPAIGQHKHSDYTGIVVINADQQGNWFVRLAQRERLTPTQIVNKAFDLCAQYDLQFLGIESVAYQEALLYFISEEMGKRQKIIPIAGVTRSKSKESRILALVPRFEWSRIFLYPGMVDLEDEIDSFPRGSHDDILDALASLEEFVYYPEQEKEELEQPHSPNDPRYEKWYINKLVESANSGRDEQHDPGFAEFGS